MVILLRLLSFANMFSQRARLWPASARIDDGRWSVWWRCPATRFPQDMTGLDFLFLGQWIFGFPGTLHWQFLQKPSGTRLRTAIVLLQVLCSNSWNCRPTPHEHLMLTDFKAGKTSKFFSYVQSMVTCTLRVIHFKIILNRLFHKGETSRPSGHRQATQAFSHALHNFFTPVATGRSMSNLEAVRLLW